MQNLGHNSHHEKWVRGTTGGDYGQITPYFDSHFVRRDSGVKITPTLDVVRNQRFPWLKSEVKMCIRSHPKV